MQRVRVTRTVYGTVLVQSSHRQTDSQMLFMCDLVIRATVLLRHMITTCANHERLASIGCESPVENLERLFVAGLVVIGTPCLQASVCSSRYSTVVDEPS